MKNLLRILAFLLPLDVILAQPALVLGRVHTNMLPVVQAPTVADARTALGVNIGAVDTNAAVVVADFAAVAGVVRTNGQPTVVITRYFATEGDGGAARYIWVNSSAATNFFRIAAAGGGRWVEEDYLNRNWLNVRKCGATGFDTSDDSTAFQRAFDAALQQSTGNSYLNHGDEPVIYIPAGRYFFYNTVSYVSTTRNHANIRILGDGMYNTHLIAKLSSFPEGGNKPLFYIQNVRLYASDFRIRAEWAFIPNDYRATGLHLKDCDYGGLERISIANMSRGIVLDCGAMNWNTFSGLQFEANYVDVFAAGAQGLNGEWHSSGSHHTWFGPASGLNLAVHAEGGGNNSEFTPTAIYIPAGSQINIWHGYNEAGKASVWLGVPLTNRVTLSTVDGTTITATFTNSHYYITGHTFTLTAEQAVPQDIQDFILGTRTVASASRTNNYLTFNAGAAVTNSLAGYTFLAVLDINTHLVSNSRITTRGQTYKYRSDYRAIIIDKAFGVEISGSHVSETHITRRARLVKASGVGVFSSTPASDVSDVRLEQSATPPINIFPDPWFVNGTNWGGPGRHQVSYGNFTPTNYLGMNGVLFHVINKPTSVYPQFGFDFTPLVPMSSLNGRRLQIAAIVYEVNHPSYKPTEFTVNSGGTGYVDGVATVTDGNGRTVQVSLTTSAGAITGATWYWGAFSTNTGLVNLPVTQNSASGGTITPTGFQDFSAWTRRDSRNLRVLIKYRGENILAQGIGSVNIIYTGVKRPEGDIRYSAIAPAGYLVDGAKPGFRLILYDDGLGTANAVGTEAYVLTFVGLFVEGELHRPEYALHTWFTQPAQWSSAWREGGSSLPVPVSNGAVIFGRTTSGVTGLGFLNSAGVSGHLPYLLNDSDSDYSNVSPGAFYYNTSTSTWRIFTGTVWRNF